MRRAFTLAEVLLTLLIIGVVAALTIPSLLANVNDSQNKAAWKQGCSIINQALAKMRYEEGLADYSSFRTTSRSLAPLLKKYLQVKRDYNFGDACHTGGNPFCSIKNLDGTYSPNTGSGYFDDGQMELMNGMFMYIENVDYLPFVYIWIDVDGRGKGANTVGKDVFGGELKADKFLPFGSQGDSFENTCTTTGWGCSAEFLK